VRESVAFTRLPWIRPLVGAHARDFPHVASLFAGNPADPTAWRETIARVQQAAIVRTPVPDVVAAQLARRQAPKAAQEAAGALQHPATVAVVTGQQAGLFGGPLYTALKAITTIQLARKVHAEHGVPVVPIFWVDAEDHDFAEIRSATVLDRDQGLATVSLDDLDGAGSKPVGSLTLDDSAERAVDALAQVLGPTEFTSALVESLRRHYRPGQTPSAAFSGWLDELLGGEGLVVFDASDPAAKPAVATLFARELADPCRTAHLAREAGASMARLGHTPQIEPADDVVCLFYMDGHGRRSIRRRDGQFFVGDDARVAAELSAEAARHPERFSPNVLLRPLVQDTLFPTVCYVAGPSELAYHAQLAPAYEAFGIPRPLLASRASATLLDSAAARFLDRYQVPLESLQAQDDSALNRLLEAQLPPALETLFEGIDRQLVEGTAQLKPVAVSVDPTLAGAVDTTLGRVQETFKTLQGKILHASKKKDDTLRRQFARTRTLVFPGGTPQERALNVVFFINRYGPALMARLIETLPPVANAHYVITP
jgi:bacillithiol synthase